MGREAVVRGEFHVSNVDRKALLDRDLSHVQTLYMEGRSDEIKLDRYTNSYMLYLLGYFSLELIYITANIIHTRLLPFWAFDIKAQARQHGLDVNDEIDLEIHEIYENVDDHIVHGSLAIFIIAFVVTLWRAFYEETIDLVVVTTPIPYWLLPLVIGLLLPLGYSGLLITVGDDGERDTTMAVSITEQAADHGHEDILVLVGDKHVDPVSDALEAQGWSVTRERSAHPIPRVSRFLWESNDTER